MEERERLGFSRPRLAQELGITPQYIGEIERSESAPGSVILAGFAQLGADCQYILTGVRSTNVWQVMEEFGKYDARPVVRAFSSEELDLMERLRALGSEDRAHAAAVIAAFAAKQTPAKKRPADRR